MRNNLRWTILMSVGLLLASGCKSPFGRTQDSQSGPAGSVGGSGQFTVFSNELTSGGGAFEYPGGDNLSLAFDDHSNPISRRSIRFSWTGQPTDGTTYTFAGVSFMHVPQFKDYNTTTPRDFRAAGYTQVSFYARASLSTFTSVKIEAGGPTSACMTLSKDGTIDECGGGLKRKISGDWGTYSLPVTSAQQSAIKDLFKATFIFDNPTPGSTNPGQGGTLYLDQIFYKS
jgi:hypothetical protein